MSGVSLQKIDNRSSRIASTLGYYATFALIGAMLPSIGPALPRLAERTGVSLGDIGFLYTAAAVGVMGGSLIAGRLYDRHPGHPLIARMLIIMAVITGLMPVISNFWILALVFLCLGLMDGGLSIGTNTLTVWTHGHSVEPYMNGLHFAFGIGATITPIILAQVILKTDRIDAVYWILAVCMLFVSAYFLRMPQSPVQIQSEEDSKKPVNRRLLMLIVIFFFLHVGAQASFGIWLFTYVTRMGLANERDAAYMTSVLWIALTVGRLLLIALAVNVRPRTMLLGSLLGGISSTILLLIGTTNTAVTWMGVITMGLSSASLFPATLTFAESNMGINGQVMSIFFVGTSLAVMTLPWFTGNLIDGFDEPRLMLVVVLATFLMALGAYTMMRIVADRTPVAT